MTANVLILSGDRTRETELAGAVRVAGGWVTVATTPDAVAEVDVRGFDLIVADLRGFGTWEALATIGVPMIAEIDAVSIDAAAAALDTAQLLVDPDPIERAATIAVALAGDGSVVREDGQPRLRQLSEEAGRIARALADLASDARPPAHPPLAGEHDGSTISAALVRSLIRKRRLRDRFFAANIFADPAWDMLLDLYAARLEGVRVAVSSLCIAAYVPPTTALRWIRALTDDGLFVRVADPKDRRRIFIALSEGAADRMAAYLASAEGEPRP